VAANTVCRIGNNKFIHLLPFIIPGLTGKRCNNQAIFFRVFICCSFLRAASKKSAPQRNGEIIIHAP
ncbi:hypothetical protein NL343_28260, partial [Klebsiella pneumoniae]|nr:hypothetical protein [Klebsiella pneumoniae]